MKAPIYLGAAAYERSFGIKFITESEAAGYPFGDNIRVLPNPERWSLREDLKDKSVAVVGNGKVEGCGEAIDGHDVVIRISTMRHWNKNRTDDGVKMTIWAGQPLFVVHQSVADPVANHLFEDVVRGGVELWGLSPFHITLHAFKWLIGAGGWSRFLVAPPPFVIYERMCNALGADDLHLLFAPNQANRFLVGLPFFELLLTGTRLLLLLELAGASRLGVFGFNLFSRGAETAWFGHAPHVDLRVMLAIKRRLQDDGRQFYWHEEDAVLKGMPTEG